MGHWTILNALTKFVINNNVNRRPPYIFLENNLKYSLIFIPQDRKAILKYTLR